MPRIVLTICLLLPTCGPGICPGSPALAADPPDQLARQQLQLEVDQLIEQLDDERFELRQRAAERLETLVAQPELGELLAIEFQRALVRAELSFEVRWHLEGWSRRLPEAPNQIVEKVSPEEVQRLLGQLNDDSYGLRLGAARRLESLLYSDVNTGMVRDALQARLAAKPDAETVDLLNRLLDLARPAMVAEYWRQRQHLGEQYLLVDVPSLSEGADRPSHFDRIDDRVAHCVSGHNLAPGDYPVGEAFPHPKTADAFFHLVNLPTPRRRLEYWQQLALEEGERLAGISRRTLDRVLAEQRQLDNRELVMLAELDPEEVSRFAGKYFNLIEDSPLPAPEQLSEPLIRSRAGGQPSRFGVICAQLAVDGTKHAIVGLLEAIDKDRFLPPSPAGPCRLHWYAALSIAERDPWPEVDDWLGSLLGRDDLLVEGLPDGPQLSAAAAAVLLERHGQSLSQFGLQKATGPTAAPRFDGYRFQSDAARQKVLDWWQQELKELGQL